MKRLAVLALIVLFVGCTNPIHIEHREGKVPKIRIKTTYEPCKIGGRTHKREIKVYCKWPVEF